MMLSKNLQIALVLAVSSNLVPSIDAVKSYLSYQNAVCTDSQNIAGTMIVSYDDSYWNAFQMSLDYEGECGYYANGYMDVDNWDDSDDDAFGTGYCVTCNGIVGCSSDGTCDNFMTYPVEASSSGSGYQMTTAQTHASSENQQQLVETPAMTLTQQAQKANIQAMMSSSQQVGTTTSFGSATIVILATLFVGAVASVALVISLIHHRHTRIASKESSPSTELPYYLSRD